MPTLILLDVSLSMARHIDTTTEGGGGGSVSGVGGGAESVRTIDLASKFIIHLLDHLSTTCPQEYTSLVIFSSLYETLVKYTRDYDVLKAACDNFDIYDKTIYERMFHGVESLVAEDWGKTVAHNIVLITDGVCGVGEGSLKELCKNMANAAKTGETSRFPFPFSFPFHLSVVCLGTELDVGESKAYFEQLIQFNHNKGELLIPDSLSEVGVEQCFRRLTNLHYKGFETVLKCGHFQSHVTFSPPPNFQNTYASLLNYYKHPDEECDTLKLKLASELSIVGFLDLKDFGNPPFVSRHLVLPLNVNNKLVSTKITDKDNTAGTQPSFCVLLHGSLKIEKMGALVKLNDDWYGMLYSWSDQKKKSNLMLSIFEPGGLPFPWLGDLSYLGPAQELPNAGPADAKESPEDNPFPLQPDLKHSYQTVSSAVWIKSSGLQSDIQKLLRYARKLPDKQSAFFKEVNKLRRAGMMYGFHEMLFALAEALEKESENMKPEVIVQLRHVAEGLRNAPSRDVTMNILAINTFRKKAASGSE